MSEPAESITKILALSVGGACFILMVFFSPSLNVSAARFLVYPIFTGFVVLYIAFAISVFLGRDSDVELNSVWALYGVAAYIAVGTVCILMFKNADTTEAILGVIAGSISYLMAAVLVVDVVVLQNE
ncbi:hypothetical protein GE061_008404 [Apolygus lucorum]|uniref:MARVEL domain-containing protein n=1 Tax=Apolygus lucorum TaxID=248454 RepID=A0A6A4ITR8_APOLU|nr:hypothetical protein GE061_008404 [Apolygus lucorum]